MKASVINAVPANSGDKLLLESSLRLLQRSGFQIQSIHSNQLAVAEGLIESNLHRWDLDRAVKRDMKLMKQPLREIVRRLPNWCFWSMIRTIGAETKPVTMALESSDWIFSSAGGYLNDRYGYSSRLRVFEWLLAQGKQLVLLPQSIGPFESGRDHRSLRRVLEKVRLIMLRDDISVSHLKEIGVTGSNVTRWPDLGLLSGLFPAPRLKDESEGKPLRVLFCAREWDYRSNRDDLVEKLARLLDEILKSIPVDFVFASTCQGIQGYHDDSLFMNLLKSRMNEANQERVELITRHLDPTAYFDLVQDVDCYIGMRMHGAIIALHAGLPSLAIGYEEKSREVFSQLLLDDCCVDMNDPTETMLEKCLWFLRNLDSLHERVRLTMKRPALDALAVESNFKKLLGMNL